LTVVVNFFPLHPATDLFSSLLCRQFKSDTHSLVVAWMLHQQQSTRSSASQHIDTHVSAAYNGAIGWLRSAAAVVVLFSLQHGVEFVCPAPQAFSSLGQGQQCMPSHAPARSSESAMCAHARGYLLYLCCVVVCGTLCAGLLQRSGMRQTNRRAAWRAASSVR
jgi:hypothetical protein